MDFVKNKKNKKSKKNKKQSDEPQKDYVDLTKDITEYVAPDATKKESQKTETLKIVGTGYSVKRKIAKIHVEMLKTKFNKFYIRTVGNNSKYFGKQFIKLVETLKININKLKVEDSFSNSFLQWYDKLEASRKKSKDCIKKIDSVFKEAKKNNNDDPTSSSVSYTVGSIADLESISGNDLEKLRQDLLFFISEVTELKEIISSYHPVTRELENLSLAKSCEHYWKIYIEKCRKIKKSIEGATNITSNSQEKTKNIDAEFDKIKSQIEDDTFEQKEDYYSAFESLKASLENKKSIFPSDLPKEEKNKLDKALEYWNEKNKDLGKLDNIKYEGKFAANIKKRINEGSNFFRKVINKITGVQSDIDKANAMLRRYGILKD